MKRNCYKLSWTFSLCRFRFRFRFCFSICFCFCFCFCFCLLSFFSSIFFVGFSRRLARLIDILYLPLGAKQNIFEILYLLSCSMRRRFTGCAKGNGGGGREERRMLAWVFVFGLRLEAIEVFHDVTVIEDGWFYADYFFPPTHLRLHPTSLSSTQVFCIIVNKLDGSVAAPPYQWIKQMDKTCQVKSWTRRHREWGARCGG